MREERRAEFQKGERTQVGEGRARPIRPCSLGRGSGSCPSCHSRSPPDPRQLPQSHCAHDLASPQGQVHATSWMRRRAGSESNPSPVRRPLSHVFRPCCPLRLPTICRLLTGASAYADACGSRPPPTLISLTFCAPPTTYTHTPSQPPQLLLCPGLPLSAPHPGSRTLLELASPHNCPFTVLPP